MADQADFPDIYIDESVAGGGVGSEVDPYSDFSEINWSATGDNSITDWYAGVEDASVTINLEKGQTWREKMTVGASGSATYPILIRAHGTGNAPKILRSVAKNATGDWTDEGGNLWHASPGAETWGLVFDSEASKSTEVENKVDLDTQGESWWDDGNSRVYVYSVGNPATVYSGSIECQFYDHIIDTDDKSYLTFDGLDLRYTGKSAIVGGAAAKTDIIVQNCIIKYCGCNLSMDPNFYAGGRFFGRAISLYKCTGLIVDDNTISHASAGVHAASDGTARVVTISDNTISNLHGYAGNVDCINFAGTLSDFDGSVVSGNDLSGFGDEGIDLYYAQNIVISGNEIYDNVALDGTGSGSGIKGGGATGAVHSTGHTIVRNYIHDLSNGTDNYAITTNKGESCVFAYNKIHDCAVGVLGGALGANGENDNWEIYNNIFYNMSAYGIHFNQGIDTDNRTTLTIRNNICDGTTADINIGAWITVTGGNNCLMNDATATVNANSTYTGTDLGTTDPLFTNAASDDFTLQVGSPCINAGVDVGLTTDYVGNSVLAIPDIGAYEHQGVEAASSQGSGLHMGMGMGLT